MKENKDWSKIGAIATIVGAINSSIYNEYKFPIKIDKVFEININPTVENSDYKE